MGVDKPIVINVLTQQYTDDCRIKNTIAIPLHQLESYAEPLHRGLKIIVYCAQYHCPKSTDAWYMLKKMGFTNCFAYEGGMREWFQKDYPCDGECQLSYLREPSRKLMREQTEVKTISAEDLKKLLGL